VATSKAATSKSGWSSGLGSISASETWLWSWSRGAEGSSVGAATARGWRSSWRVDPACQWNERDETSKGNFVRTNIWPHQYVCRWATDAVRRT
jgi:hypothetical protein